MKKTIYTLAASVLVMSTQFGVFTTANAEDGKSDIAEYCKNWTDAGIFDSVGACMGRINGNLPKVCKEVWDHPYYQANYGWKNQGDCVSDVTRWRNQ